MKVTPDCFYPFLKEHYDYETVLSPSHDYPYNPTDISHICLDTKYIYKVNDSDESSLDDSDDDFDDGFRKRWVPYRIGTSVTKLNDGRVIMIAGEYEDYYDPQFFIYNDVIVFDKKDNTLKVYGYPKSVFPPTDFHEAILIDNTIWIIGTLGYQDQHTSNEPIQVCSLNINTFEITKHNCIGEIPRKTSFGNSLNRNSKCELHSSGKIYVKTEDNKEYLFDTQSLTFMKSV